MKKRALKVGAAVLAFGLIAGLGFFSNGLLGNPYSKYQARKTAEKYLESNYSQQDFYIDAVNYSFKDGNYSVVVAAPDSIDVYFTLTVGMNGTLRWDNYEAQVEKKENTARRLEQEYRQYVKEALEDDACPYQFFIDYGTIVFFTENSIENQWLTDGLSQQELELDQQYDIEELGRKQGKLVLYVEDETVSIEKAADIMLKLREYLDGKGIAFRAMDFVLEYPRTEDGSRKEGNIYVENFLCDDITAQGMEQRVEQADQKTKDFFENYEKKQNYY